MDRFEALKISGFDHVEIAVADLDKASQVYLKLGFEKAGSREILERQLHSLLFVQNQTSILLSQSALRSDPVARFVSLHGDGVYNIAFRCEDAVSTLDAVANRGADVVETPKSYRRDFGAVNSASIRVFGDVRYSFVTREGNLFAEGFDVPIKSPRKLPGLLRIDHFACAIEPAQLDAWLAFHEKVLGLREAPGRAGDDRVYRQVLQSPGGELRFPVAEPGPNRRHVQEYLDVNHGPGVSHLALLADNLIACLRTMKREGLVFPFSPTPEAYHDLNRRVPQLAEDPAELAELGIQVESDPRGYLLQAFTQPVMGAFFLEILQRNGGPSLGEQTLGAFVRSRATPPRLLS
jgi:4-hydroxyphenylpyruvate dioxygenase